ncbi:6-phosphogluconolactonase/glucosamine-6-phosphate isomerase/deaminase [Bradyrhizobium sp. S3.14.4]
MAAADQPKLIVEADAEALAQAAAERVMARISANPGRIAICLTGGSEPEEALSIARQRGVSRQDPVGPRALVHR